MKPATPILRNEHYLDVMTGGSASLPSPILREERYLAKLAGMDVSIPNPVTIKEKYYAKICGMDVDVPTYTRNMPRIYAYMAKAAGQTIEELPTAVTREQRYWYDYVLEQPVTEHEYTGAVPYTFRADGTPLLDWYIKGNTTQSGTPTPQNPVDVLGTGERTAQLFDGTIASQECGVDWNRYGFTVTKPGTYTVRITGTVESGDFCYGRTYSNSEWSESFYLTTGSTKNTYTVTISENEKFVIFNASGSQTYAQAVEKFNRWKIMANTGSTALPYEPWGFKIPILLSGTTTPVYLGEVQTERAVKKVVFDGTESGWSFPSGTVPRAIIDLSSVGIPTTVDLITVLSTHYVARFTDNNGYIRLRANGKTLNIADATNAVDETTWKAFLAAQYANGTPVTVWYVLATPQTAIVNEPLMKIGDYADSLTAEQAGTEIATVNGSNTIDVDTTVKPSEIYIKWKGAAT